MTLNPYYYDADGNAVRDLDEKTIKDLEFGLQLRAQAKEVEDEAKELKETAAEILRPLMVNNDITIISVDGLGVLTRYDHKSTSFSKIKAFQKMAELEIDADIIQEIRDAAESTSITQDVIKWEARSEPKRDPKSKPGSGSGSGSK